MNEEQPPKEPLVVAPVVDAPKNEAHSGEHQSQDPRRRLRELLAVPDRDRTDAIWDEIIALEIQLAPGNRAVSPQAEVGRRQDSGGRRPEQQGRRPEQARGQEQSRNKPATRFFKKRKRGPGTPP
jgi:hypothetical protein